MTPEALEAEQIARRFGLTYLSPEGYAKLAALIAWLRAGMAAQSCPNDLLLPPPKRYG